MSCRPSQRRSTTRGRVCGCGYLTLSVARLPALPAQLHARQSMSGAPSARRAPQIPSPDIAGLWCQALAKKDAAADKSPEVSAITEAPPPKEGELSWSDWDDEEEEGEEEPPESCSETESEVRQARGAAGRFVWPCLRVLA